MPRVVHCRHYAPSLSFSLYFPRLTETRASPGCLPRALGVQPEPGNHGGHDMDSTRAPAPRAPTQDFAIIRTRSPPPPLMPLLAASIIAWNEAQRAHQKLIVTTATLTTPRAHQKQLRPMLPKIGAESSDPPGARHCLPEDK